MTREEQALQYKQSGCNCCQSVVKALAEGDDDMLSRAAAGFGTGMGGMEATCGALIGAVMAAGLAGGTKMDARRMLARFQEYTGAVSCKDIKGRDTGVVVCQCPDCIRNAVRAYEEVMADTLSG